MSLKRPHEIITLEICGVGIYSERIYIINHIRDEHHTIAIAPDVGCISFGGEEAIGIFLLLALYTLAFCHVGKAFGYVFAYTNHLLRMLTPIYKRGIELGLGDMMFLQSCLSKYIPVLL
jgi:hypothetical protein